MVGTMLLAGLLLLHLWPFSRPAVLIPRGMVGDVSGQSPACLGPGAGPDRRRRGKSGILSHSGGAGCRGGRPDPQVAPDGSSAAELDEDGELSIA